MKTNGYDYGERRRIIWAVAAKDIADALRNKATVTSLVTVIFLVALYSWLPRLAKPGRIDLVIYDAGSSRLAALLEQSNGYRIHPVSSLEDLRNWMDDADSGELGLAIPTSFDGALDSGKIGEIDGYVLWNRRSVADQLISDYERRFEELLAQPVQINVEGTIIPESNAMGSIRIVALTLVIPVFFLGVLTVPHLLLEEKRSRTIETLLLSPATISQLIIGKGLAGLFYCLGASLLLFALNWTYVVNWGLAIAAVVLVTTFAVGLGLALGTFLERKQQLGSWVLILGQPLLIPVFLSAFDPIFPESVRNLLSWMPIVSQTLLFRYAFSDGIPPARILGALSVAVISTSLVLLLVIWKVRRMDN